VQRTLEKHDYNIATTVEVFEKKHKRTQAEFSTMEMLAYASAYSPRSATRFDLDLPFELKTGQLRDDVFARWVAFDPVERVASHGKELGALRLRYLDCGRRDEYGLDIGSRLVAERIRALGLSVRHEEFDDDHRNVGYRYEISLPALAGVLDTE
jgi:enterochelin esterase family protein